MLKQFLSLQEVVRDMRFENYEPIEYKLSPSQVEKQKREISEQFDILSQRQLHFQFGKHEAEYFKVWGTNFDTEMDVDFLKPENYVPLWKWYNIGGI